MTKEELRSEWADRIAAYRSSGQTQHAWCTTQDVSINQLKYWLYKNKEEITPKDLISHWLPLNVSRHEIMPQDNILHVEIGHATIEVKPGFNQKLLLDVFKALSSLC